MNTTIEIKHAVRDENKSCYECTVHWGKCRMAKKVEVGQLAFIIPGPDCPGPGRYRLIDEAKIEELWKNFLLHLPDDRDRTIEFTVNTVRELFTAAGLGKGETK